MAAKVFAASLLGVTAHVQGASFKWEPLPNPDAVCLDGSRYGLISCVGPGPIVNFTINIQGGGWCYNEQLCLERSFTSLGSSNTWPAAAAAIECIPAPGNAIVNMFYGDGASFTGYRAQPWPVPGNASASLFFRGWTNLVSSIEYMISNHGLGGAAMKLLVVTGGSAGGLSTFLHLDYIAARMAALGSTARVVGRPVCGFFIDAGNDGYAPPNVTYPGEMAYVYNMQNSSGALSSACQAAHAPDSWKCIMAPYAAAYVKTPWFAEQSRFDDWQLENIAMLPCAGNPLTCNATEWAQLQAYGPQFMAQFLPYVVKGSQNGAFLDACIIHGSTTSTIDGLTNAQAFNSWLLGNATYGNWWIMKCNGSEVAGPCDRAAVCKPFPNTTLPLLG